MEILFFLQDKTYTGTTRVNANKNNMLITGRSDTQWATINMNNRDKAFHITGSNVTLRHINFVNGKASESGGAISCYAPNIKIQYCNFNNNVATEGAGAIGISGYNVNINNCRFTNNRALGQKPNGSGAGGAIAVFGTGGTLRVNNCVFINNSAATFGGAISSRQTLIITGSTFNSNLVRSSASSIGFGGAISTWSITTISNSVFNSNSAVNNGGAISTRNTLTLTNSKFNNNRARYGGAIFTNSSLNILSSSFTNNFAGTRISIKLPNGIGYNSTRIRIDLYKNNNFLDAIWKTGRGTVKNDNKQLTAYDKYIKQSITVTYNKKSYTKTTNINGYTEINISTKTINLKTFNSKSSITYVFTALFNRPKQYTASSTSFTTRAWANSKKVNSYWNIGKSVTSKKKTSYQVNKKGIKIKTKTGWKTVKSVPKKSKKYSWTKLVGKKYVSSGTPPKKAKKATKYI